MHLEDIPGIICQGPTTLCCGEPPFSSRVRLHSLSGCVLNLFQHNCIIYKIMCVEHIKVVNKKANKSIIYYSDLALSYHNIHV